MSQLCSSLLSELRQEFGLQVFVETGCFQGDGIQTALDAGFGQAFSCDIDLGRVKHCEQRFASRPVQLFHGDSLSALRAFQLPADEPCLFWLDAHYPGVYGLDHLETSTTRFPLAEELQIIHELRGGAHRDVILADDMRVVEAPDNPRWRQDEVGDYYRVEGFTISGLTAPFSSEHHVIVDCQQEGLLRVTPILP